MARGSAADDTVEGREEEDDTAAVGFSDGCGHPTDRKKEKKSVACSIVPKILPSAARAPPWRLLHQPARRVSLLPAAPPL